MTSQHEIVFRNNSAQVMTNPELRAQWLKDVKFMADRIISMRTQLRDGLAKNGECCSTNTGHCSTRQNHCGCCHCTVLCLQARAGTGGTSRTRSACSPSRG